MHSQEVVQDPGRLALGVGGSYLALALHPVWEEPTDVGQGYKSILSPLCWS